MIEEQYRKDNPVATRIEYTRGMLAFMKANNVESLTEEQAQQLRIDLQKYGLDEYLEIQYQKWRKLEWKYWCDQIGVKS